LRDPSFNRFWLIHPCDRRTDRQTDGQTDGRTDGIAMAYTRYSVYAVARKNGLSNYGHFPTRDGEKMVCFGPQTNT